MVQRVAIYARVSTNNQSCERQITELASYVARNGFEVVANFRETGIRANKDRVQRNKSHLTGSPSKRSLGLSFRA